MPGWEIDEEKARPKPASAPGALRRFAIAAVAVWVVLFPPVMGFQVLNGFSDAFTRRTDVVLTSEGIPVDLTWFQAPLEFFNSIPREAFFTSEVRYFDLLEFASAWLSPAALILCLLSAPLVYRWVRWGEMRPAPE